MKHFFFSSKLFGKLAKSKVNPNENQKPFMEAGTSIINKLGVSVFSTDGNASFAVFTEA